MIRKGRGSPLGIDPFPKTGNQQGIIVPFKRPYNGSSKGMPCRYNQSEWALWNAVSVLSANTLDKSVLIILLGGNPKEPQAVVQPC